MWWLGLVAAVISLGMNSWAAYHDPYIGPRLKKFFRGLGRAFPIAWGWIKERADYVLMSRRAEREQYMSVIRAYGNEAARLNREIKRLRDINAKMNSQIKAIEEYSKRKSSMDSLVKELQREYEEETYSVLSGDRVEPIKAYSQGGFIRTSQITGAQIQVSTIEPESHVRTVRRLPQLTGPDMPVTVKGVDKHDPDVITESYDETMTRLRKRVEENSMVPAPMIHVGPKEPESHAYGDKWYRSIGTETCDRCGIWSATSLCGHCNMATAQ